jgi:hypothetical protein
MDAEGEIECAQETGSPTTSLPYDGDGYGGEVPAYAISPARATTLALRPSPGCDVQKQLASAQGYDCALARPWASGEAIRLQAVVEGPLPGVSVLQTPLTQRPCVLYSASASQETHGCMHPVSVAHVAASVGFTVRLLDPPFLSVQVSGDDVLLFDLASSRHAESRRFSTAPADWQGFALSRQMGRDDIDGGCSGGSGCTEPSTGAQLEEADPVLEFQECALLVGSKVTLVGELNLHSDGTLVLQPWQWNEGTKRGSELPGSAGDTSGQPGTPPLGEARTSLRLRYSWTLPTKVLVSDDPELLVLSDDGDLPVLLAACA